MGYTVLSNSFMESLFKKKKKTLKITTHYGISQGWGPKAEQKLLQTILNHPLQSIFLTSSPEYLKLPTIRILSLQMQTLVS